MAEARPLRLAPRLLGEMAVIFLSVVLALAADDWRQERSEAMEATQSLDLILSDLRRDSASIENLLGLFGPRTRAARWLVNNWNRTDHDPDSLPAQLALALSGPAEFRMNRAGFDGLLSGNGLRLIDNASVRSELLEYYQAEQPAFVSFVQRGMDWRLQARRGFGPYAGWPSDSGIELETPWAEVARDGVLRYDVTWASRVMITVIDQRAPQMQDRINALVAIVSAELA